MGIVSVLVSALFIITFIVQAFEIPSSSMEDTLLIGDHVFVNRLTPGTRMLAPVMPYPTIHHGDIIVFFSPVEPGLYIVKRVIGVPGDRIHLRQGKVYRNGVELNEPYVIHKHGDYQPVRDDFPLYGPPVNAAPEWPMVLHEHREGDDVVVPPGHYWGMGDNREESMDSRYWGFIPRENIIGEPLFIYWSFETPEDQYQRTAMRDRVAFIGHIIIHFFDQTRWRRMLHLVR